MLKIYHKMLLGVLALGMITSCTPEGAEYIDELDIVYTNHDPDFVFSSQNTYALPDQVVKITEEIVDGEPGDEPEYIDPAYSVTILNSIRSNMNSLGYTEVDKSANPDLIVLPSAMQTDQLYFYYDWWYWNWWYPGWGTGWGWYYPGYYPPQVSRIRTGTVFLQMTQPEGINAADQIPVIWTGVMNGLLEGSKDQVATRINNSINQAFTQSPYLAK
ncbi:DUF4136 domain-containing protein [Algoriphagus zhangzhouensis]|uniref:DUF4136 domain-containing protein n=1 Tax=Algoriphagus zhangzhouensis TaxID=1073327 RepID=A0A1M7ZHI6_9BACT|nr:DUF4136 domain-containing protein [Algoriphagus zhangzhouensis]SHO64361.1 protein of unknown function [Algoriphagus zhangzhouensis]